MALLSQSIPKADVEVTLIDRSDSGRDKAVALYLGSVYATLYLSVDEALKLAADLVAATAADVDEKTATS